MHCTQFVFVLLLCSLTLSSKLYFTSSLLYILPAFLRTYRRTSRMECGYVSCCRCFRGRPSRTIVTRRFVGRLLPCSRFSGRQYCAFERVLRQSGPLSSPVGNLCYCSCLVGCVVLSALFLWYVQLAFQQMENVNNALNFLRAENVSLVNIGPEGNGFLSKSGCLHCLRVWCYL